jgi:hypothetical protein
MKPLVVVLSASLAAAALAGPVLEMNRAFNSLMELLPFLVRKEGFLKKENEKTIAANLAALDDAFKLAGHDSLLRHDLFAPSYELISTNLREARAAFGKGPKDYSLWLNRETVGQCIDCHSRLPQSVTSSFQNGELTVDKSKLADPYNLGLAYLIVRRYVDAKNEFTRDLQDRIIKKDGHVLLPLQQILLIELKIKKDPASMLVLAGDYLKKGNLPYEANRELEDWKQRLGIWTKEKHVGKPIATEGELRAFLDRRLAPLKKIESFDDAYKVDLLLASGLLSQYFFENQTSKSAPEMSYWLGWIEKRLKKEEFFGAGDLFLKQCIRKYPKHPVARECLKEYKESVEFDFSGSSGTFIPDEVQAELKKLNDLVGPEKKLKR